MMKRKRKVAGLVLALGLALATMVATAPQAGAAVSCPSGRTCVYDAQNRLLYSSAGNANVRIAAGGGHVWNNGYRFPGAGNRSPGATCPEQPGNSGTCLRGHFVAFTTTGTGFGGPDLGVTIIKLVG